MLFQDSLAEIADNAPTPTTTSTICLGRARSADVTKEEAPAVFAIKFPVLLLVATL